jgi:hypothetical protein
MSPSSGTCSRPPARSVGRMDARRARDPLVRATTTRTFGRVLLSAATTDAHAATLARAFQDR